MQILKPKPGYKLVKWHFGKYEEIPIDWKDKKIDDMIKFEGGSQPPRVNFVFEPKEGYVKMIQIRDFKTNRYPTYILKKAARKFFTKDDVMIGRYGPPNFQVLRGLEGAYNVALIKAIPKNMLEKDYLYYFLKQKKFFLLMDSLGQRTAGQDGVELDILKKLSFPLPSKKERLKIISILSNVDNLIQTYDKVIESSNKLKKGLMQQLLTKGIGHKKFKKIFLKYHFLQFTIPNTWEIKNVKQLSTLKKEAVVTGPFGLMLHSSDYVSEGTPLILIKNLQNGKIVDDDIPKISDKDVQRLSRYKVKEGDMIFSRVGRVGSSVLIEEEHNGWLFSGQTLRIRFENPELNSKYVKYYFHSNLFNRVLIPELLGATRDSINTKILEEFPVIVPPKKEQDQIVAILSQTDSREYELEKIKSAYKNLKKGLMQKLLTGQMRV